MDYLLPRAPFTAIQLGYECPLCTPSALEWISSPSLVVVALGECIEIVECTEIGGCIETGEWSNFTFLSWPQ